MFNEILVFISATDRQNLWFFIQLDGWNLQFYSMIIWQNSTIHSFFFPSYNGWSIKRKRKAKIHEKASSQIACVMRSHWYTMKAHNRVTRNYCCRLLVIQKEFDIVILPSTANFCFQFFGRFALILETARNAFKIVDFCVFMENFYAWMLEDFSSKKGNDQLHYYT